MNLIFSIQIFNVNFPSSHTHLQLYKVHHLPPQPQPYVDVDVDVDLFEL